MNGHSVVFGQLVQKLQQIAPNTSTLQDDQNGHSVVFLDSWLKSYDILGFNKISFSRTRVARFFNIRASNFRLRLDCP